MNPIDEPEQLEPFVYRRAHPSAVLASPEVVSHAARLHYAGCLTVLSAHVCPCDRAIVAWCDDCERPIYALARLGEPLCPHAELLLARRVLLRWWPTP